MYRVIFSYVVGTRVVTEWKRHVRADELSATLKQFPQDGKYNLLEVNEL